MEWLHDNIVAKYPHGWLGGKRDGQLHLRPRFDGNTNPSETDKCTRKICSDKAYPQTPTIKNLIKRLPTVTHT